MTLEQGQERDRPGCIRDVLGMYYIVLGTTHDWNGLGFWWLFYFAWMGNMLPFSFMPIGIVKKFPSSTWDDYVLHFCTRNIGFWTRNWARPVYQRESEVGTATEPSCLWRVPGALCRSDLGLNDADIA